MSYNIFLESHKTWRNSPITDDELATDDMNHMPFVCCVLRQRISNTLPAFATNKVMGNAMIDHVFVKILRQLDVS